MKLMKADVLVSTKDMEKEDWLKWRKKGIGGSDAAAICGLSKWSTPLSVYLDKTSDEVEVKDNEAMRQGRDLEEYVAERFVQYYAEQGVEKKIRVCNQMLANSEHPFVIANVDRLIYGEDAGLECKTTRNFDKIDFENGDIPREHYVQCMHYMLVTGASKWYLAELEFGKGFYVFEILRDEEEINSLLEIEKTFWNDYVLKRIAPDPTGKDVDEDVVKKLTKVEDENLPEKNIMTIEDVLMAYANAKEVKEIAEQELNSWTERIKLEMGEFTKGSSEHFKVSYKKSKDSEKIDSDRLKKERPEIWNEYKKIQEGSRRLLIKDLRK